MPEMLVEVEGWEHTLRPQASLYESRRIVTFGYEIPCSHPPVWIWGSVHGTILYCNSNPRDCGGSVRFALPQLCRGVIPEKAVQKLIARP